MYGYRNINHYATVCGGHEDVLPICFISSNVEELSSDRPQAVHTSRGGLGHRSPLLQADMVTRTCNSNTHEVETEESELQGHLRLLSKFGPSLGYMYPI